TLLLYFFFFQAEDGIRDRNVTGVQTCALPLSHSNNIKLLLDIQDKKIEIEENAVELRSYQGRMAKFITVKLTYPSAYCECCGVKNEYYTIYKNGTKTLRITLPISGVYRFTTFILLLIPSIRPLLYGYIKLCLIYGKCFFNVLMLVFMYRKYNDWSTVFNVCDNAVKFFSFTHSNND